tara:strand:- start:1110 stop:1409 length:300 start_codon:yes stop_codon:yes gene_type:complete
MTLQRLLTAALFSAFMITPVATANAAPDLILQDAVTINKLNPENQNSIEATDKALPDAEESQDIVLIDQQNDQTTAVVIGEQDDDNLDDKTPLLIPPQD